MIKEEQKQTVQNEDKIHKLGKQKKIKKLIKRVSFVMHVPKLICIQNYFQISESCIINQSALKDPQNCTQSLLANTFYFKRIGSIHITENILQLNLKDIISPKLPINYFIDRYKSFGNQQFYDMSLKFQRLLKQFAYLSSQPKVLKQMSDKQFFQILLYNHLDTLKDKKYICYYYEPNSVGLSLKKLLFSKNLLELVGLDIEQIRSDYIKHKHIFFEIFGGKFYKEIVTKGISYFCDVMEDTRLGRIKLEEVLSKFAFSIKTFIHRIKKVNNLIYEEEVEAEIKLYKPHFFMTIIEFSDFNESRVVRMYPLSKQNITVTSQERIQVQYQNEQSKLN